MLHFEFVHACPPPVADVVKKALITGIDGFTGRYLAAELAAAGYDVHGISVVPNTDHKNMMTCDILNVAAVADVVNTIQPDVVCHLAAITFVAHGDADEIYRTNILGTRNLLAALTGCITVPGAVLLASSSNIYGNSIAEVLDEDIAPSPINDYAVSKVSMELMARLWTDHLPITIVRPFNYTGLGQSPQFLIPKIVDHFRRKAPFIELGNLDVMRDFSDVRMVVKCYRRLIETASLRGMRSDSFNICSGVGFTLTEILNLMRHISGHNIEVRVNPAFVRKNEVVKLIGSKAKLESAIGTVEEISFRETLAWMYHASSSA